MSAEDPRYLTRVTMWPDEDHIVGAAELLDLQRQNLLVPDFEVREVDDSDRLVRKGRETVPEQAGQPVELNPAGAVEQANPAADAAKTKTTKNEGGDQ